ncbi:MAG: energy-coupling factor transporter ATPase [Eubacteriales bacterium]|nr:energy-coupling factor transporter ATPase [Eubacteriales bacterium]
MSVLELKNLTFSYAGSDQNVLTNVSMTVEEGEFVVVMGKSGSGKTTLLKCLKKNTVPAGKISGEIKVLGRNIENLTDRENASLIGLVGQNPDNGIVTDKVYHELAFGLENLGIDSDSIRKRVAEMSEYFGITSWYERNVETLSGGQKQILNLASVMVMQPEILLLDEPGANLDPLASRKFLDVIKRINRELGVTVIIVEHNLENIYPDADKVIYINEGRMEICGTPQEATREIIESKNVMKQGLPAAIRIYDILHSQDNTENIPLTISQGRRWINNNSERVRNYVYNLGISGKVRNSEDSQKSGEKKASNKLNKSDMAVMVKNVTFSYEKNSQLILEKANLSIKKNIVTGILGSNGSGKSTVLKLISGIMKGYKGKITHNGRAVMLPQNPMSVFTEISVEEELAEVLMDKRLNIYEGFNLEEKKAIVENVLKEYDLDGVRKQNPYDLSGGQQEKLAVAKVLLLKPDILLLDEPTNGLDPYFKKEFGEKIRHLCDENVTVIIVSHDLEFVAEYTDECMLLFDKNIVTVEDTNTFFGNNIFYTTDVNRIMSGCVKGIVSYKDLGDN